eukprot:58765-Prorocentrum_minimum.AAC.1
MSDPTDVRAAPAQGRSTASGSTCSPTARCQQIRTRRAKSGGLEGVRRGSEGVAGGALYRKYSLEK